MDEEDTVEVVDTTDEEDTVVIEVMVGADMDEDFTDKLHSFDPPFP